MDPHPPPRLTPLSPEIIHDQVGLPSELAFPKGCHRPINNKTINLSLAGDHRPYRYLLH